MIETLFELVKTAGVDRMNISIQPSQGDRAIVCIQCILGAEPKDATPEQFTYRHALAKPISIEGLAGEVDAKLDELVTAYVRAAVPVSNRLITNATQVQNSLAKAEKVLPTAKSKTPENQMVADGVAVKVDVESDEEDFDSDEASSL